jgi:O-antigen ligase
MAEVRTTRIHAGQPRSRIAARKVVERAMAFPRDPFRVGLFVLTVLTISRFHQHFGFLKAARPALALFAFSVGYLLINPNTVKHVPSFRTWPAKVILALGILACISVPFGISMGKSATFILENYSKVLIFAFFLFVAIRRSGDLRYYMWAFVISAAILSYFSLFVFDIQKSGGSAVTRLQGMYTYDSNDLGVILIVALPLAILFFQTSSTKLGKWFAGAVIVGIGMSAGLSGSRGAFLGLIAVGLSLLLILREISVVKRVGFVVTVVIALAVAAPPGYWEQMNTLREPTADYNWDSQYGRRKVWMRGLGYMMSSPVTGIGIGNFGRAEGSLAGPTMSSKTEIGRIKWSASHNSFIQVGAEVGFPALLLWSSLVFGGLVSMRRLRRRMPSSWARGDPEQRFLYGATVYLPVALIGFAVTASFVSFAYQDPIYVLAVYLAGMYVSVGARLRQDTMLRRSQLEGRRQTTEPRRQALVGTTVLTGVDS